MTRLGVILLGVALLTGTAAAVLLAPADPVLSGSIDTQTQAKARALVELISPHELMVETNYRGWEVATASVMKLEAGSQKLEAAYPGVTQAALAAARPLGRAYSEDFVRDANAHKADLIARGLSDAELDEALALHGTAVWKRFVAGMAANADQRGVVARNMARSVVETGAANLTRARLDEAVSASARRVMETFSAEDHVAWMRLQTAASTAKLRRIGTETTRWELDRINNPDRARLAEQQQAMRAAIVAFVDARGK